MASIRRTGPPFLIAPSTGRWRRRARPAWHWTCPSWRRRVRWTSRQPRQSAPLNCSWRRPRRRQRNAFSTPSPKRRSAPRPRRRRRRRRRRRKRRWPVASSGCTRCPGPSRPPSCTSAASSAPRSSRPRSVRRPWMPSGTWRTVTRRRCAGRPCSRRPCPIRRRCRGCPCPRRGRFYPAGRRQLLGRRRRHLRRRRHQPHLRQHPLARSPRWPSSYVVHLGQAGGEERDRKRVMGEGWEGWEREGRAGGPVCSACLGRSLTARFVHAHLRVLFAIHYSWTDGCASGGSSRWPPARTTPAKNFI